VLLGASLFTDGFQFVLNHHCKSISLPSNRLKHLSSYEAFLFFKNCLSIPKWLHLLRLAPSLDSCVLDSVDRSQRLTISDLLNIHLSDASWIQASLPVRWGGVGVRSVADLALSLASSHFVSSILQPIAMASFDALTSKALSHWSSKCNLSPPSPSLRSLQHAWDDAICSSRIQSFLTSASGANRAHLLASSSPFSGAWLHALQSANIGLRRSDQELRVSVSLRFGADAHLLSGHTCTCGSTVLPDEYHGLLCRRSAGRDSPVTTSCGQ